MNARIIAALTIALLAPASADVIAGDNRSASDDSSPASNVAEAMAAAAARGPAAAVARYRTFQQSSDSLDLSSAPIIRHAVDLFSTEERPVAVAMMEACAEIFPREVAVHLVLGQFYWYTDARERCIESFRRVLELDPENVTASRFRDLLFFVPDDFAVPELMTTPHLRVRPLSVADTELDYRAVMESRSFIRGVFGPDDDWPEDDLTLEDDRRALSNHEREHRQRCAFTYTVLTPDEKECLGCLYILPCHAEEYDAQVYVWVTESAAADGLDVELFEAVRRWLDGSWPFERVAYPGRLIGWDAWARIDS